MESNIPSVRYHSTVYINENQCLSERSVQTLAVNHCLKVLNGSLESVLHLIGYSLDEIKQINRKLGLIFRRQQNLEFELTCFESDISEDIRKGRSTRAHVVEYEKRLYGVVVDRGMARICGQIHEVIPKTINETQNLLFLRGIKISLTSNEGRDLSGDEEVRKHIDSGKHIVIVSEKGCLFVDPNGDQNGHQLQTKLTLILGHGFVIIDESSETAVHWIRTKQFLRDQRRESTKLSTNESIIASFAAISVGAKDIRVYGTGSVVSIKNIKEFSDCI